MTQTSELFLAFVRRMIISFLLLVMAAGLCHAQNGGTVGIYTRLVPVFSAQSTTKSSAILPDFGFGTQTLFFCNAAFTGTVDLEWSPTYNATTNPNGTFYSLTQASYNGTADTGCHQLPLGQYWPNLRSTVTPLGGTLSAWYSGQANGSSFWAPGLSSNGAASPIVCDHSATIAVLNSATTELVGPINTGDTIIICNAQISFEAAPSAGSVAINFYGTSACTGGQSSFDMWTTSTTPQSIFVGVPQRSQTGLPVACAVNSSGAEIYIAFSYASVHGL